MSHGSCTSAWGILNYRGPSSPVGNQQKLFKNSELFWFTHCLERALWLKRGAPLWMWSRSRCWVEHNRRRIQRDPVAYYPLGHGSAGVFCNQNTLLMDGLRFTSQFRYDLHGLQIIGFFCHTVLSFCSPSTLLLSSHHQPPSILYPICDISPHPTFTTFISCYPHHLHHFFTSPPAPSKKLL